MLTRHYNTILRNTTEATKLVYKEIDSLNSDIGQMNDKIIANDSLIVWLEAQPLDDEA